MNGAEFLEKKTGRFKRIILAASSIRGLGAILIFTCLFISSFTLLDWFVRFSTWMRIIFFLGLCGGWCYFIITGIYLPLYTFRNSVNIARHLEKRFPLHDAYESALFFREKSGREKVSIYTNAMLKKLELATVDLIASIRDIRIIDRKKTIQAVFFTAVSLVAYGTLFFAFSPIQLSTARILFPVADYNWPEETGIQVIQGSRAHPRGETLMIEAATSGKDPKRCSLVMCESDSGKWQRISMVKYGSTYRHIIKNPRSSFSYRIEAGGSRSKTYNITVINRPELQALWVNTEYPEYTNLKPVKEKMSHFHIRALKGSMLDFTAELSKPVNEIIITDKNGKKIEIDSITGTNAVWHINAEENTWFLFECRDSYGFTQKTHLQYTVWAENDNLPAVTLVKPRRNLKLIVGAEIPVGISATDNYGIHETGYGFTKDKEYVRIIRSYANTSVKEASFTETLAIDKSSFKEGDRLIMWGQASDFNPRASSAGQSDKIIIEIISNDELLALFQREKVSIKNMVEALYESQTLFVKKLKSAKAADPFSFESDQHKILTGLQNTEKNLQRLLEDYQFNKKEESGDFQEVSDVSGLTNSAKNSALKTIELLRELTGSQISKNPAVLQNAEHVQEELSRALDVMKEWEIFEHIISMLQSLISDQEQIAKETLGYAGTIPRKEFKDLSKEQQKEVGELAEKEKSLKRVLEKIEFKTEEAVKSTGRPGRREQLKRAVSFIHDELLYKKFDSAVVSLNHNRIFAAYAGQRDMLSLLTKLEEIIAGEKSLKERFKDMEAFTSVVKDIQNKAIQLLSGQEQINKKLKEGMSREKLKAQQAKLAKEMKELLEHLKKSESLLNRRELNILSKMTEAESALGEAGKAARSFSEFMSGLSSKGKGSGKKAEDKLKEFIEKMKKLKQQAEDEKNRLRKKDFVETLKAVLDLQKEIGRQMKDLTGKEKLAPDQIKQLQSVKKKEELNKEAVDEIIKAISTEKEHVFSWILKDVSSDMQDIIEECDSKTPGKGVLFSNEQIIKNLHLVIKSLVVSMKSSKKEGDGPSSGGGGDGGGGKGKVIPPLFELKLIREIQNELNGETEKYLKKEKNRSKKIRVRIKTKQEKLLKLIKDLAEGMK